MTVVGRAESCKAMCRLRKCFSQERCGSKASSRAGRVARVTGQGTVFRRALCLFWYSAVPFLAVLIIVEHGEPTYSIRKLCSPSWLRVRSQTWERPGEQGAPRPPGGSGHLGQRFCQSSHNENLFVSITRAPVVSAPRTRSFPNRVILLREKHHVTAQEVYTGSALTPYLLCAGSRLPSSGIPALGHLCKLHTRLVSRLPALELTSDTPSCCLPGLCLDLLGPGLPSFFF